MYNRREDSRLRVPSPAVSRRQFRSPRDTRSAYNDDHIPDPRCLRSRDPSPGGLGRLSTSAPTGGDLSPYSTWRSAHRDYPRMWDHSPDGDHRVFVTASSRARETLPPGSRTNTRMVTSSHGYYVNGEAARSPQTGRGRPRSFPEQRVNTGPAYLADQRGAQSRHGSSPRRELVADSYRGKNYGSYADHGSPNHADVLMSAVVVDDEGKMGVGVGMGAEMVEGSFSWDDGYTWHAALTCYLCAQLFRRPRILPCGHTFCSECLAQLKDESLREGRKTPGGHAACAWEGRQKTDVSVQFVCPIPECRYSMRLINLSKWSTRNKTVSEAVDVVRRIYENRQDACTQTDITMDSLLVTIPRAFMQSTPPPGGERGLMRRNSSSLVDRMVHRALSMDSLSRSYIPQQHVTWRSYAAMLGMHILEQVLHT